MHMAQQVHTGRGWRLLRSLLELVAAVLVGMLVIDAAVRGLLAVTGLRLLTHPELVALEMAFAGSVGVVVWMRHRGHGWASILEMTGAMFAPAIVLIPLLWLGVVTSDALILLEHLAMLPLLFLVLLRRRS